MSATISGTTLTVSPKAVSENKILLTIKESTAGSTATVSVSVKVTITLNNMGAPEAGTESITTMYNTELPNITPPSKIGSSFVGYYTADAQEMVSILTPIAQNDTKRINLIDSSNGWKFSTADAGTHIQGKILLKDSTVTNEPSLEFNDVGITASKIEHSGDTWTFYVDFDITDYMVTARYHRYDTNFRFIDIVGATSSSVVSVKYLIKNGKQYYDNTGCGVAISDFTTDETLYAKWEAHVITLNNQNATVAGTPSVYAPYDMTLPNISVPSKTGYTFRGYYTTANAKDMVITTNAFNENTGTHVRRINFVNSANGWQMSAADAGTHIQGKISVKDSSLTSGPGGLDCNDIVFSPMKVERSGDTWTLYIDFDLTAEMATKYTQYRFIDVYGLTSSTELTVEYLVRDGKKYYNSSGTGTYFSDFTADTTLYAHWN